MPKMTDLQLKDYLYQRYKSLDACPDYLFQAYRLLFHQVTDPNRRQILNLAKEDIEESDKMRPIKKFNDMARKLPGIENKPWNWKSKR